MSESTDGPGGIPIIDRAVLTEFLRAQGVDASPLNGGVIILLGPDHAHGSDYQPAQNFGPGGIPIIDRAVLTKVLRAHGVGAPSPNGGVIILLGA